MSWILDSRIADPSRPLPDAPPVPPPASTVAREDGGRVALPPPPPPFRISRGCSPTTRRACAAAPRWPSAASVSSDGVPPLVRVARRFGSGSAADGCVRARAASATARARDPLVAALADSSPLVKGSAAEALGLIGDAAAADADRAEWRRDSSRRARCRNCRQTISMRRATRPRPHSGWRCMALVQAEGLRRAAAVVLDDAGSRAFGGGRLRSRCSGSRIRGRCPRCWRCCSDPQPYTRAFAAKGLGAMKDRCGGAGARPAGRRARSMRVAIEAIRALGRLARPVGGASAASRSFRAPKPDPHAAARGGHGARARWRRKVSPTC